MKTSFLSQVDGFTPVIDAMVVEYDLMTAAVYGRVWRYCQMRDGVCKASHQKIADDLGVSRQTALRKIHLLCDEGFLKDLTPNRRNKPHEYADTGKAKIMGLVRARVDNGVTEDDSGVTESNSTVTESHSRCNRESHEDSTKIEPKKQKNNSGSPPTESRPQEPDPLMKLLDRSGVIVGSEMQKERWYSLLEITDDLELIKEAFVAAADQIKRPTPAYITTILDRCLEQNCRPDEWPDGNGSDGDNEGGLAAW